MPKGSYTDGSTYTVKRGDTLFYIAWVTSNDFRDLAQRNNIPAPYALNVGQVLQVGNASGQPITAAKTPFLRPAQERAAVRRPAQLLHKNRPRWLLHNRLLRILNLQVNRVLPRCCLIINQRPQPQRLSRLVTAPTTVSTTQPTASSTSTSSPISAWRWPTDGKVIENFSGAEGGNKGIDIAGSKGQAIVATADGRVVYAGNALRGYGNLIIIKHNDDYLSAYAHNDTMLVREQQEVKAGQKIATMGSTGTSSTRLHFEIRYKGKSVNPLQYLPQR
ncbi:murein hydrolase activator NlpD [Klebsiella pneumoniae]